jgi:hypothetical protein
VRAIGTFQDRASAWPTTQLIGVLTGDDEMVWSSATFSAQYRRAGSAGRLFLPLSHPTTERPCTGNRIGRSIATRLPDHRAIAGSGDAVMLLHGSGAGFRLGQLAR